MTRSTWTAAAALGLMAGAAAAQDAGTGGDQQMRDTAIQNAQTVGIPDAQHLEGAVVLQGTSSTGTPILVVVGPAGELLALANPMAPPSGAAPQAAPASDGSAAAEPAPGEPAEEGFMATQTQPMEPQMWDPAAVEGELQRLQGTGAASGTTTTTGGETTEAP
ncbi:hypothetical protein [Rubellimicrobium roseum]|uniref:PRC-barrel domain containing protein n=1 Tax=Rubellimicrobium roseum TaxID=687525 RepID=A0A5C4N856_9RHOB|nr:hypothetical protein [Rubellimicrobium roseum]TNC60393.1 hypothetical protein FHG71_22135 [Rubellimicrobium roseum]